MLDFIQTLILFALVYSNSRIAAKKGRSGIGWGFFSLGAFLFAQGALGFIFLLATYKGPPVVQTPEGFQDYVTRLIEYSKEMQHNGLKMMTLTLLGAGGALAVRYLLEKMPVKNADQRTN